ncbi:MAG: hypothetical protein V4687_11510 [Bacteroidota bacterium]
MIKKLLTLTSISCLMLASCSKEIVTAEPEPVAAKPTATLEVPKGFTWENSRAVNLNVTIADTKFSGKTYIVAIYATDPSRGSKILSKGALSTAKKFKSKMYLSNQITELYLICMAPDKSTTSKKVLASTSELNVSFGN